MDLMFEDKTILVTGGTGSFGNNFIRHILENYYPEKIIIFSRDEYKQYIMSKKFFEYEDKLRFFIGDVRDKERVYRAFNGVDLVIHAAALKQVPTAEYNPLEAVKTNIYSAENIINAAIDQNVEKVVSLSTDKAVNPVNLYGATKLVSDKLFISGNAYIGEKETNFSVVRYGNVASSRGSIIPFFLNLIKNGSKTLPITDPRMTRFWVTVEQAVMLVITALKESKGGELYVGKYPSHKVVDLALALNPDMEMEIIGIRPGEKLHEVLITAEDSRTTYEYDDHFIIYPDLEWCDYKKIIKDGGKKVQEGFVYASNTNEDFFNIEDLKKSLASINCID
jgi:UDP-N-acetylglucosamine 4,6-dehydratase (inverting)